MLPDTFGFLDKVLIKLRSHFGRSFEHATPSASNPAYARVSKAADQDASVFLQQKFDRSS